MPIKVWLLAYELLGSVGTRNGLFKRYEKLKLIEKFNDLKNLTSHWLCLVKRSVNEPGQVCITNLRDENLSKYPRRNYEDEFELKFEIHNFTFFFQRDSSDHAFGHPFPPIKNELFLFKIYRGCGKFFECFHWSKNHTKFQYIDCSLSSWKKKKIIKNIKTVEK